MVNHARPVEVAEALQLLNAGRWTLLAGGTDFYPALGDKPLPGAVLDVSGLHDLRVIDEQADYWHIGALSTWSDIIRAGLPPAFDALRLAAREIGSIQIQNRATIAGNLCNASPAADGVPPLLILDAQIELLSLQGKRTLPLTEFIVGNRRIERRENELLSAIIIPKSATRGYTAFHKLGARRYLVISILMVAARLHCTQEGFVAEAAVAVGACSAVARRLSQLEQTLIGRHCDEIAALVNAEHVSALSPVDDIRSSAPYRLWAAQENVRRALQSCVERYHGR